MLPKGKVVRFGVFTFSRLQGLRRAGKPVAIRHLERQLLKCLLDRPGEIVRKDDLVVVALWPDVQVAPNTLNVHVRRLRVAPGDTKAKLLKVFPRMGYMLIAEPQTRRTASSAKGGGLVADKSRFIRDVTIPDGSIMSPGERFEKVWEIQNVGTMAWKDRAMRRTGVPSGPGRLISEPQDAILDTNPGELCLVRMWLTAPGQPGSYYASWKMVDKKGAESLRAQSPLFVSIDVVREEN